MRDTKRETITMSKSTLTRKKTNELILFICFAMLGVAYANNATNETTSKNTNSTTGNCTVSCSSPDTSETHTTSSSITVYSSLPDISNTTNQTFTTSTSTTDNDTNNTSGKSKESLIKKIQPFAILVGVGILFLLLVVNLISVLQRRKDHHVIQSYLLSLHTLLPFLRNYADITNINEENPKREKSLPRQVFGNNIEEYDEIEMVARRSKPSETKDVKRVSEADHCKEVEKSEEEPAQVRSNVYSLQKEIFSSDL